MDNFAKWCLIRCNKCWRHDDRKFGTFYLWILRHRSVGFRYSSKCPRCGYRHSFRYGQPTAKESGNKRGGGRVGSCVVQFCVAETFTEALKLLTLSNPHLQAKMALERKQMDTLGFIANRWSLDDRADEQIRKALHLDES